LALDFSALLHALGREAEVASRLACQAIAISEERNFPVWLAVGKIISGWAFVQLGEAENGLREMEEGLKTWQSTGSALGRPYFLALMAEALHRAGQVEEALTVVGEAIDAVEMSDERVHEAELLRLQGELMSSRDADPEAVEKAFRRAVERAKDQGARSMELRALVSLTNLLKGQGKLKEAREDLAKAYAWFDEDAPLVDLESARNLLREMESS
jgi:predicted ATPase